MLVIYRISNVFLNDDKIEIVEVYFDLEKVSLILGRVVLIVTDNVGYFGS